MKTPDGAKDEHPHDPGTEAGGSKSSVAQFGVVDPLASREIESRDTRLALRRARNVVWQTNDVDRRAHAALKGQRPCVVWLTGLSAAGKSTIANVVEKKLHALGRHTFLLDGDNVRHGLNVDLGFTEADRVENVRRLAEVARLMADAGLIVLVACISPFRADRRFARGLIEAGEFCEVFLDVPLEVAEQRDRKGLYAKARRGELKNFTGIDSPYEVPEAAELVIDTAVTGAEDAADRIVAHISAMGVLSDRAGAVDGAPDPS